MVAAKVIEFADRLDAGRMLSGKSISVASA
jgi:hypothetical protein